jgi:hypothetical protein
MHSSEADNCREKYSARIAVVIYHQIGGCDICHHRREFCTKLTSPGMALPEISVSGPELP